VASDCLVNQHADVNRTARILGDESKVEFLVVQDQFLTPTARFADVVLPACTQLEVIGIQDGWKYGNGVIFSPQVVAPLAETKSDYRICVELAERLGLEPAFSEGRSERDWVAWAIERYRRSGLPEIPTLEEFERGATSVHSVPVTEPEVAFAEFRRDPEAHPLGTPSGKIEIFSKRLHALGRPDEIPAVPKYIQEWESPFSPEAQRFPLSLVGHHCFARVHSTHDNNDWLEEAFPQRAFVHPIDARARGIESGDEVRIFNARGAIALPCRVTRRILPGVVAVPQGAWWTPDERGTCRRGSVNVLTSQRWTPYAYGNAQHTAMVQLERVEAT
jgi:anaerobic dimethyl sulfoxide reductase subunit A